MPVGSPAGSRRPALGIFVGCPNRQPEGAYQTDNGANVWQPQERARTRGWWVVLLEAWILGMAVWVSVGEHWAGEHGAWVGLAGTRRPEIT
jgi:hypothetical protein